MTKRKKARKYIHDIVKMPHPADLEMISVNESLNENIKDGMSFMMGFSTAITHLRKNCKVTRRKP